MATAAGTLPVRPQSESTKEESQFQVILRRFVRHRLAVVSIFLLLLIFVASLLAPVISTFPRDLVDVSSPERPAVPGITDSAGNRHILGIDQLGRDLFTRVLYAARVSLSIALIVTALSQVVGVIVGATAAISAAG